MRLIDALLILIIASFVGQLVLASLLLALPLALLCCLLARPKETLTLGLCVCLVVSLFSPPGLIVVGVAVLVLAGRWLLIKSRTRPKRLQLPKLG